MKSVDDLTSRLMALMFFFCFSVFFLGGGVKFHTLPKKKKQEFSKVLGFFSKNCFAKYVFLDPWCFFGGA